MSSTQDTTKTSTVQPSEKDTVAETIAYARRTYKGNHPDVKTWEPEKYAVNSTMEMMRIDALQQRTSQEVPQQH